MSDGTTLSVLRQVRVSAQFAERANKAPNRSAGAVGETET